jgi:hypothetical protein
MRILAGVGAWLLGVGTATAGSLLAVSLLGQGIADSPGQQLTMTAVNRALAREAPDSGHPSVAGTPAASPPLRMSPATSPAAPRRATNPPALAAPTPSAAPAASRTAASPSPQAMGGTVLVSQGGTVLAECRSAGAYLVSWSPTQGYEADDVTRGPAATARVVFGSDANSVTMVVTCPDGAAGPPVASSYIRTWGGGPPPCRGGGGTKRGAAPGCTQGHRCFPALSSTSNASVGQAWAARLA